MLSLQLQLPYRPDGLPLQGPGPRFGRMSLPKTPSGAPSEREPHQRSGAFDPQKCNFATGNSLQPLAFVEENAVRHNPEARKNRIELTRRNGSFFASIQLSTSENVGLSLVRNFGITLGEVAPFVANKAERSTQSKSGH